MSPVEARAARSLRRWLRRAALAAIPAAGLACGHDRCAQDMTGSEVSFFDGGWAVGSQHSAQECSKYCPGSHDDTCWSGDLSGCYVSPYNYLGCTYTPTSCAPQPCGRLPAGIAVAELADPIAAAAWLEGAAVFAFEALERELIAHGASADLIEGARKAQCDERRHHAAMSALARHFGSAVRPVEVEARPVRTLAEIACENAVEGCVRETWGAAVAAYQAACAQDRTIRRVMGSIAADEAEHAALGWAVDAWACSLLSVHERAHVGQARTQAHADLVSQAAEAAPHETLGLPGAAASLRMLRELRPLWAA